MEVSGFTPRPLYPRGKSLRYPLKRKLDGPLPIWTRQKIKPSLLLPRIERPSSSP